MRTRPILALTAACLLSLGSAGTAQETQAEKKLEGPKPPAPTPAALRAEIHRTTAALIEAQAAKEPDEARIQALTERFQRDRQKLRAATAASPGRPARPLLSAEAQARRDGSRRTSPLANIPPPLGTALFAILCYTMPWERSSPTQPRAR